MPAHDTIFTPMQQTFPWLIVFAAGATLVVLVAGVIAMLRHGKVDARTSNKLMRYRVAFQLAAILLVGLAFLLGGR